MRNLQPIIKRLVIFDREHQIKQKNSQHSTNVKCKIYIYTDAQKFGISKIFYVFLRESLLLIKAVFIRSKIQKKKQ